MIELAVDQTVEQVLNRGFYVIPRFQRPFSWTADNVGDFWADTIQSEADDYFIGSMIVYEYSDRGDQRGQSPTYAVVDGQQRLTTITILLAALRNRFRALSRELADLDGELSATCQQLAEGVHGFVETTDRRALRRRVLEAEAGYPYLQTFVQRIDPEVETPQPVRPDERRIEAAYRYFDDQLRGLVDSTRSDPTISAERRDQVVVERLEDVRDQILNLSIILVVVDNEDDAYEIFETLNTRGQDLNLADLVRNFLLRDLREEAEGVDSPRTRYTTILERLHDPDAPIDPAQFILHSWLSREAYTSRKRLFRDMKQRVQGSQAKRDLLTTFEVDEPLYRKARFPRSVNWGQQRDIGESIDALIVFKMTQPLPLVLSALRAHEERRITMRNLRRLLRGVEAFHFQFTAVAGRSSSGGISKRYASAAQRITGAAADATNDEISDLLRRLRESAPTAREFDAGFAELSFWSGDVSNKQLVQYTLRHLYEHHSEGSATIDFSGMTIEHLAPERSSDDREQLEIEHYSSIGNLILVSAELNGRLSNKPWADKREILRSQREIWIPSEVLAADEWAEEQIRERTQRMAEVARDGIWRI